LLWKRNFHGLPIRMISKISAADERSTKLGKDMESSKRYLLQAEIEYWHEMLRLNRSRVSKNREVEMRNCLKEAVRALNSGTVSDFRVAA